jgi:eukaryotic-like serine/threonine-protein kinase
VDGGASVVPTFDDVDAGVGPGDVLAGKYRVDRILGVGGMGVVVAAQHLQLDEKVALKFLLPAALKRPEILARFEREARAAVKIKSEHVARVIDVGRLDNGAPYMVMEHLDGLDLRQWLREHGPMSAGQAAEFVLQACEAIAEAHVLGIVHRDLKPANLFCTKRADGVLSIKVLDFGISKVVAPTESKPDFDMTTTGAVVGSPAYMSPEQLKSARDVDSRTDVWSLGVILYELVAGRVPFDGASLTELAIAIVTAPPRDLRTLVPGLPVGFEDVVKRCMARELDDRTRNVAELAVALRDYAPRRATSSVERILRTMEASGASTPSLPASGKFRDAYADTVSADAHVGTGSAWGQTGVKRALKRRTRRTVIGTVAAGALLVALCVGAVLRMSGAGNKGAGVAPSASTAMLPPPASAPAPSIGAATTDLPVTGSATPADVASGVASAAPSKLPARPIPRSGSPATAPPQRPPPALTATPTASPTCRIVTEYDAEGLPHFKKVCD